MSSDRLTWTLTGATVAGVLALYVPCAPRTVPGGDSGELMTAACELGVAHPPGYPLFTVISSLMLSLLPFSSPAHTINVLCAVFGAVASGALCFTVCSPSFNAPVRVHTSQEPTGLVPAQITADRAPVPTYPSVSVTK